MREDVTTAMNSKAGIFATKLLLVLAFMVFATILVFHIGALAGRRFSEHLPRLFEETFLVAFFTAFGGAMIVMNRTTRDFKQRDLWRAALRGCPKWMRPVPWIVWGYAFFVAFALSFVYGGG